MRIQSRIGPTFLVGSLGEILAELPSGSQAQLTTGLGVVGTWANNGTRVTPCGVLDLTKIGTLLRGVVAAVVDGTHLTLVAGHSLVSGMTVRCWDTSAGAELGDRTITVSGNNVTLSSAIVGAAAGDQLWCVDLPISMGAAAAGRELVVQPNSVISIGTTGVVLQNAAAGHAGWYLKTRSATKAVARPVAFELACSIALASGAAVNNTQASCGLSDVDGSHTYRAGGAHNGAVIKALLKYGSIGGASSGTVPADAIPAWADVVGSYGQMNQTAKTGTWNWMAYPFGASHTWIWYSAVSAAPAVLLPDIIGPCAHAYSAAGEVMQIAVSEAAWID